MEKLEVKPLMRPTYIRLERLGITRPHNDVCDARHLEGHVGIEVVWSKHDHRVPRVAQGEHKIHKRLRPTRKRISQGINIYIYYGKII